MYTISCGLLSRMSQLRTLLGEPTNQLVSFSLRPPPYNCYRIATLRWILPKRQPTGSVTKHVKIGLEGIFLDYS